MNLFVCFFLFTLDLSEGKSIFLPLELVDIFEESSHLRSC